MIPHDLQHQYLLLLPLLPSDISLNSLRVAYGPALKEVFQQLAHVSADFDTKDTDIILTVAVACKGLSCPKYSQIQQIYALIYRLTCILTMEMSIDIEFGNDIDIRVVILYSAEKDQLDKNARNLSLRLNNLVDLASSQRLWNKVYSMESESGEELLHEFLQSWNVSTSVVQQDGTIIRVPGGLTVRIAHNEPLHSRNEFVECWTPHRSVAVGGTFDHLHAGHKLLLTMTALVLEPANISNESQERHLTIGITGDDLLKNKSHRNELETWEERQSSVQGFLLDFLLCLSAKNSLTHSESVGNHQGREVYNALHSGVHIKYKEIFDPFGPTITDPNIAALVISAETRAGGKAVNDKRAEKKWHALEVFEVDVLDIAAGTGEQTQSDFESKISSTEIRSKIHQKKAEAEAYAKLKGD